MTSNEQLKPCPFCSSVEENLRLYKLSQGFGFVYLVSCTGCVATTGKYKTEEQAIKAWNNRPEPKTVEPTIEYGTSFCGVCDTSLSHTREDLGKPNYCYHCGAKVDRSET